MQRVAGDPLAAVQQPSEVREGSGQADPAGRLDRLAGAGLVRDRAYPADPGGDVGRLGVGPACQERLEEPGRLVDVEAYLLDPAVADPDVHRAFALDARYRLGGERAVTPVRHVPRARSPRPRPAAVRACDQPLTPGRLPGEGEERLGTKGPALVGRTPLPLVRADSEPGQAGNLVRKGSVMTICVGINGFGRIGRTFVRRALERSDIEVVAVNDITDARTLAHLLEFDSTYGRLNAKVTHSDDSIIIDGTPIRVLSLRDPAEIDWGELGADIVVESTGKFRARDQAALHLKGGARKVLLSAPGKGADLTVVVGVNDDAYDPARHDVISNASCTTNCVAPMAKVLLDSFGIVKGFMTTIHAYTGDQMLIDGPHKDLRRARSAAISMVPTTTGAAKTTGEVIPELAGRLDGVAVRVPVEDGSLTDLTAVLGRDVTAAEINAAFEQAAAGPMAGILHYSTDPLVARDIIGDPASCVFDSGLTQASGSLAKVFGWYDNEWGYTCRLADLVAIVGERV